MLSRETAQALKEAGLIWRPDEGDLFIIPDRDLDDHIFILSRMSTTVRILSGSPAITFQGSYEWALDYIFMREVIWLPSEEQLRAVLEERLQGEEPGAQPALRLTSTPGGYVCEVLYEGKYRTYEAREVSEVYAAALLDLLQEAAGAS
jgi:hypothetical protein